MMVSRVLAVIAVPMVLALSTGARASEPVTSQYILGQLVPVTGEEERRSVDLDIRFELNSSRLTEAARAQLVHLGTALTAPELSGMLFAINGHTDASGSATHNRTLSQQRADAVKDFLVREFRIEPKLLEAVGWGEDRLKNTADPNAAENRRVEIVNLTPMPARVPQAQPREVPPQSQPAKAQQPAVPAPANAGGMQAIN